MAPGQFTVLDTSRPFFLHFDRSWSMLSYWLPRELLDPSSSNSGLPLASAISGNGLGAIVTSLFHQLWRLDDEGGGESGEHLARAFSAAVTAAVTDSDRPDPDPAGPGLRLLVTGYLEQHFSDPTIDTVQLARRFNVSTRTMHSAFESGGQTLAATLRDIRLQHAMTRLTSTDEPVTLIGQAVGYPNPDSFRRAFDRRFGMSPTAARALRKRSDIFAGAA